MMQATVKKNVGGQYPAKSVFKFYAYVADPGGCNLNTDDNFGPETCIATFPDGKSYLGTVNQKNKVYTINFWHSNSTYTFNKQWKATKVSGGKYAVGSTVKVVFAANVQFP